MKKSPHLQPPVRPDQVHEFRLYVAGDAPHSRVARSNLTALCTRYLPGQHVIQIVDVLQHPGRLLGDGIIVTPTLVRVAPAPEVRIVGALTREEEVCVALGFNPASPQPHD